MIRIELKAKTDGGDYKLNYKIPESCNSYKVKYNLDYNLKLDFYNADPKQAIIEFIESLEIVSHKDTFEYFYEGIRKYVDDLYANGLHTCEGDLLSGNWSFDIQMYEIKREWL